MFELSISAQVGREFLPFLRRKLTEAHRRLKSPLCELSLAIVSDATMRTLHKRFMNSSASTDVLTFPLERDSRGRIVSGEVIVCLPEARRQAKSRGVDVKNELLLYALHGMLHLCGFDDRTDRDYRRMHRREDRILRQLGVGPVFAPAAADRRHRGSS